MRPRILPVVFIVAAAGCKPTRTGHTVEPGKITCFEPPPDVVNTGVDAAIKAKVPKLVEVLEADFDAHRTLQRIRKEIPGLQAYEVMDFRLCNAVASGLLSRTAYDNFTTHVYKQLVIGQTETPETKAITTPTEPTVAAPTPPSERLSPYEEGRRAGQAVRGIRNALAQFQRDNQRLPATLDEVAVAEYLGILGEGRIRYRLDEARGFELRFAGEDGALDTPDDKVHHGN